MAVKFCWSDAGGGSNPHDRVKCNRSANIVYDVDDESFAVDFGLEIRVFIKFASREP